jgi:energy-coupling factor transporter ATP-binding protein EcfA2
MKLERAILKGYRSHFDTTVELQEYACIIGRNDAGKSAFLRALRLLMDPNSKPIPEDVCKFNDEVSTALIQGDFTDVPANWPYAINGNLSLRLSTNGQSQLFEVLTECPVHPLLKKMSVGTCTKEELKNCPDLPDQIKADLTGLPGGRLSPEFWKEKYYNLVQMGLVEIARDWGPIEKESISSLFKVVFLAADTKAEDQVGGMNSTYDELGGLIIREAAQSSQAIADATIELQKHIDALAAKDEEGKWIYEPLNQVQEILASEVEKFDPAVMLLQNPIMPKVGALRFGMTLDVEDEHVRGLSNMGHGLRRSLTFALLRTLVRIREVGVVAHEEESAPNTVSPFKVFLVEEPELYLHPQAERVRMEELQNLSSQPQTQVLLCTHSAFFVDLQGHQSIIRFTRRDRRETLAFTWSGQNLVPGEKAWLKTIRFFDGGASSMLFADCAVLCEGPTEKLCTQPIAKKLGIYNSAFEIVDCGGATNIRTYQKVLEALSVPYVAWLDGDEDNPDAKLNATGEINAISQFNSGIGSIVVNRHDWEDAAGIVLGRNETKPMASWRKFVYNDEPCPQVLEVTLTAVFDRQNLDLRTSP